MTDEPERCETCRFYLHSECRRYAPRETATSRVFPTVGLWPSVSALDWCGEWSPSPSA